MNRTIADALTDGSVLALEPPPLISVDIDWLATYTGREPQLGQAVAFGIVDPVIYRVTSGQGVVGQKRPVRMNMRLVTA